MALQAKYKVKALFTGLRKVVPTNMLQRARAFSAQYGVKKGATGFKGQKDTLKFYGEMEKHHMLKSHIGELRTYSSTKKQIVEAATVQAAGPKADKMVEAQQERRERKEGINKHLQEQTAVERHEAPKAESLTKAQRAARVEEGRESERVGEEERARQMGEHSGGEPKIDTHTEIRPDRGAVTLAQNAISLNKEEHEAISGVPLPATPAAGKIETAQEEPSAPSAEEKGRELSSEPLAAPPEPGNSSEAVDMNIG